MGFHEKLKEHFRQWYGDNLSKKHFDKIGKKSILSESYKDNISGNIIPKNDEILKSGNSIQNLKNNENVQNENSSNLNNRISNDYNGFMKYMRSFENMKNVPDVNMKENSYKFQTFNEKKEVNNGIADVVIDDRENVSKNETKKLLGLDVQIPDDPVNSIRKMDKNINKNNTKVSENINNSNVNKYISSQELNNFGVSGNICPDCGMIHPPIKNGEKCPLSVENDKIKNNDISPNDDNSQLIEKFMIDMKNIVNSQIDKKNIKNIKNILQYTLIEMTKLLENINQND